MAVRGTQAIERRRHRFELCGCIALLLGCAAKPASSAETPFASVGASGDAFGAGSAGQFAPASGGGSGIGSSVAGSAAAGTPAITGASGAIASGAGGAVVQGAGGTSAIAGAPGSGGSARGGSGSGGGSVGKSGAGGSSSGGQGGNASGGSGMSGDSGALQCRSEATHMGGLTQYDPPSSAGNCGIPWASLSSNLYGALATADYMSSLTCGMCAEITGPTGMKATIQVVDQCPIASNPKCTAGHIDLSRAAFAAVVPANNPSGGEVPNNTPVSWRYVACSVNGPIVYHFKDGTSGNWLAVQVRNARYGIASLKWRKSGVGSYQSMTAPTDQLAYYVVSSPNGATSYDFQVTDVNGQVLEDTGINLNPNSDVNGHAQLPTCK